MKTTRLLTATVLACGMVCGLPALAQDQGAGEEWEALYGEWVTLHNAGQCGLAVVVAQKALAVAEQNVGANHPDTATTLESLAWSYQAQAEYAKAEPLYKRALVIKEKAYGPDDPSVAKSLSYLASLYMRQAEYAKAEPLYKRALAIMEKAYGPDDPSVAKSLENLATLYRKSDRDSQAVELSERAAALRAK